MELRRVLLRIMLLCLALAAVGGAYAVTTSTSNDIAWQVIGSAIATAVATAVMLLFSLGSERPTLRPLSLAGLIWALGLFLIALAYIWLTLPSDPMAATLSAWIYCISPAVLLCCVLDIPQLRIAAMVGIGIGILAFLISAFPQWLPLPFDSYNIQRTTAFLGVAGLLIILCLVNAGTKDHYHARWLGILAAMVFFAIAVAVIWFDLTAIERVLIRCAFPAVSLAALIAIDNNARLVPLPGFQVFVRTGTLLAAAVCAFAFNLVFAFGLDLEPAERLTAGAGILTACGVLALAGLALLNRRTLHPLAAGSLAPLIDITIFCPRCSAKQKLKLNGDACPSCQLRIDIRIEEPRCATCGYLLYQLTSPNCPECGTPIVRPPPPTPAAS
jgi:hypothetical protein